jgi:hypothetical protein
MKEKEVKTYEYVIYIDNEPIASGKNLAKLIEEVKQKHPGKKFSIAWVPPEGVLIA